MWDGFNKRKFPRVNVACEIVVHPEKGVSLATLTENLGAGGICIMLDRPLKRFSPCQLRLELNRDLPKIDCRGKVVWAIPTKKKARDVKRSYDIGIEFAGLREDSATLIRQFLQEQSPHVKVKAEK